MAADFSIINDTKFVLPTIPFREIKEAILGDKYVLNLVIASSEKLLELNRTYRQKNVSTDILSFPLSESEGEIYISPTEASKESVKFDRGPENFLAFLFIHGCVHLKGYDHGPEMETVETTFRKRFQI